MDTVSGHVESVQCWGRAAFTGIHFGVRPCGNTCQPLAPIKFIVRIHSLTHHAMAATVDKAAEDTREHPVCMRVTVSWVDARKGIAVVGKFMFNF